MEDIYFCYCSFCNFYLFQFYSESFGLESIKSSFDNNTYKVQSKEDKQTAANIFAMIRKI